MRFLLFILSSFFAQLPFHLSAQTSPDWLEQARQDVATLSSDEFAGRGYINQGHLLAAQFIGARFESLGLTPLVPQGKEVNGFFQHFSLQINLIKDGSLIVDGKALQPGFDFIGNKYSGSEAAAGNVIDLGYGLEKKRFKKAKGKIVVIRAGWPEAIAND
ncbi:MAG: hypothetical protein NWR72_04585, partial [Bacteroidia bacterium]|nr:hypothetical protein [Bacteroidia bacterium]